MACPGVARGLYFPQAPPLRASLPRMWRNDPAGVLVMPNKYEREIEEILRNMERTEPRQGIADRIRSFNRPAARRGPRWPSFSWRAGVPETLLIAGLVLAFFAAGASFYLSGPRLLTGILGLVALALLVAGLIVGWMDRFGTRGASHGEGGPRWHPRPMDSPRDAPRSGSSPSRPFAFQATHGFQPARMVVTQVRILQLKWRYWRLRSGT